MGRDAIAEFGYHDIEVDENLFIFTSSPEEAVEGAHAIVVLTEWDEFKQYPYTKYFGSMMKPAFLFDGRNMLDHEGLRKIGFEVHTLGKAKDVPAARAGSFSLPRTDV